MAWCKIDSWYPNLTPSLFVDCGFGWSESKFKCVKRIIGKCKKFYFVYFDSVLKVFKVYLLPVKLNRSGFVKMFKRKSEWLFSRRFSLPIKPCYVVFNMNQKWNEMSTSVPKPATDLYFCNNSTKLQNYKTVKECIDFLSWFIFATQPCPLLFINAPLSVGNSNYI